MSRPQYNADGYERIAQAESDAQFEDYLAAQDDEFDPFGPTPATLDGFSDDMLESSGYDAATDAIKAEVRALLEMANAQGIDTESITLEAHEQTRNATEQDYYEAAKSALEAAIAGSNQDRGTPAGSEGQGPGAAATSASEQGLNQPETLDQQAQAATENVAPATLELAAQTPAEAAARQKEAEQAEKSQAAAKRAADAAAKAEDERKRIAQASVRAADRFELGQDPMDSLTGQGSVFDAQEPEQQAPAATEAAAPQPITSADVEQARQQAATAIAERIDAMTAQEVQKIAARFLPTMGVKVPAGKTRIQAAMTDPKVNLQAAADEVGAVLADDVKRALQADVEGRVGDAAEQQSPQEFIPAPDGGLDYGEITPEMGKAMRRQAGKIRLQHGVQNSNGTGWGLVHIEANHGKQISGLGFGSVQDFVAHVASSIQQVWQVPGNSQLLLTLKDGRKDVMYIQLEIAKEGDFYRVNSAFPVRQEDYESLKGMKKIWDGSEPTSAVTGQRPAFATAASAFPESESSQGSSNARGQDASVPPTVPAAQPDTPKLGATEQTANDAELLADIQQSITERQAEFDAMTAKPGFDENKALRLAQHLANMQLVVKLMTEGKTYQDAIAEVYGEALARNETQADLKAVYQNMAQNKRQALDELRKDPDDKMYAGRGRTDYANQAQALSGKSENGYWTRPTEMFARAFESWVFDRVTAMGAKSDYLVHGVEEDRFAGGAYKGNPYPAGEERARINAAFDKLASTIQTKETAKGVAMFATASAPVAPGQGITLQAAQQATDKVLDGLGMRGVVVPKVFRNTAAAGISDPGSVMPTGGTSNGEVYLFTDNIHDEADAFKVVFHELFHLGLSQSVKPQEYIQTMLQFLRDPLVRKYANEWKQSKDGRSRLGTLPLNNWHALAVEEALAVIGENLNTDGKGIGTKEMQGWVRRTIAWLADLAQSWKMPAVARKLRGMTYTQAEAFVQATMLKGRTGAPVLLPDTRFRSAADTAQAVGDTLKSITVANIKKRAGFKFKDYLGLGLQTLGRRQIVDIYGDLVPLAEYNRLVTQMERQSAAS